MLTKEIKASPCMDPECRTRHAPKERLALAEALCRERGVQLTPLRQRILTALWRADRPLGAYELMEAIKDEQVRPIGPPTVYRSLDFLIAQGLVTKVESSNVYTPCLHPERQHTCMFLLCSHCGNAMELESSVIEREIRKHAEKFDFDPTQSVIEVKGTCTTCQEKHATTHSASK